MNQVFDPLNLVLLAIALVVFWRLRSVLGQRTGLERPPLDTTLANKKVTPPASNGKILEFPQNRPEEETRFPGEPAKPVWEGYAAQGTETALGLQQIAEKDPAFTPKSFLEGAKMAYEMVVESFAQGDKPVLKNLLSPEVFEGFSKAIDTRQKAGEKLEFQFVGFQNVAFQSAVLRGVRASITLRFVSELISATYDKAGELIDGAPKEVREVIDVWSFERDVNQKDPNWRIVATETPA